VVEPDESAAIGGQGSSRVLLGARWHCGSDRTLKDRHHTDDIWDSLPEPFKRSQITETAPLALAGLAGVLSQRMASEAVP
jgi:hypothetical protein